MRIPKHIGIIPDGNRRWARRAGLPKQDGYAHGLEPGLELLRLARDAGVQELTFYGFTTDNCGRPRSRSRPSPGRASRRWSRLRRSRSLSW